MPYVEVAGLNVCHVPLKVDQSLVERSMPEKVQPIEECGGGREVYVPPAATVAVLMVVEAPER